MPHRIRIRQRSATSWLRRIRRRLSKLGGARLQKSQQVYLVDINGNRFKRTIQADGYTAACIERTLTRFGESDRIPGVVIRYERELWVDFIPGRPIEAIDSAVIKKIADFFSELHSRDPRLVPTGETPFAPRLQRNLRFLHRVGVLAENVYDELQESAQRIEPEAVWVGFDYTDSVLKNFVIADDDGRVCAIDVESIAADELIGVSFAKASQRWLDPWREEYLEHLNRPGVPDFRPYLPFVEMYFLAHWMQRAFVEQKWRFVDASGFECFRAGSSGTRERQA